MENTLNSGQFLYLEYFQDDRLHLACHHEGKAGISATELSIETISFSLGIKCALHFPLNIAANDIR